MRANNAENRPGLYPSIANARESIDMYPGAPTGIDLRREMDKLLCDYGAYILVRHYDPTTHSKYWNHITNEAVGGPAYKWIDYIVLSREVVARSTADAGSFELPSPVGLLTIPYVTFYLRWEPLVVGALVENLDEIYKFPWSLRRAPVADEVLGICTTKYNILHAVDLLGDQGRREYYACVCEKDIVGN